MLSPINFDSAEFKLLKLISFINNLIKEIKMEKKAPVAAPVEAAPAKKDKNVNPLLKNGVTNKDVRDCMKRNILDLPHFAFSFQDRWQDSHRRSCELRDKSIKKAGAHKIR